MKHPSAAAVPSPCISLCTMDATTGWCQGCLRTLDEIANWGGLDDGGKRSVLRRLGARRVAWRALRQAALAVSPPATPTASEPSP
jgi:predicted Fe-S protein YdhL (DUF1289 family)